jgi:protoporphyrinogen oxidase
MNIYLTVIKMKIGIIGAGITGLSLAYFLKDDFEVTVFEKNKELGGMASSFQYEGKDITNCYHHILDGDSEMIALIKELGLEDKLKFKKVKTGFLYNGKIWPFSTFIEILKFPLSLPDKIKLAKFVMKMPEDYSDKNAEEWLKEKVGETNYNVIFRHLIMNKFQQEPKEISAAWVATRMLKETKSARKKFGCLEGGLKQFFDKLAEQSKAKILLDTEVTHIDSKNVCYSINGISVSEKFDIIINTISPTQFNAISDTKAAEVPYLSCVCCTFVTDKFEDVYWTNILDDNKPFSVMFNHTSLYSDASDDKKKIVYVLKYFNKNNDSLLKKTDKEIIELFSKSANIDFEFASVYRNEFAEPIYSLNYINTPEKIGDVYFAGIFNLYPKIRNMNSCILKAKEMSEIIKKETI